jgi:hypothetical protein
MKGAMVEKPAKATKATKTTKATKAKKNAKTLSLTAQEETSVLNTYEKYFV